MLTRQFSLLALLEFTTVCALVCSAIPVTGVGPALCLIGFALALATGQGAISLGMLMATMISAEAVPARDSITPGFSLYLVGWLVLLIILWRKAHIHVARYSTRRVRPLPVPR